MNLLTLITIVLVALTTFLIRSAGYLLLRNKTLSIRTQRIMEAVPGCVLITIIAPHFATGHPADLLALIVSVLAATRYSLLPVVIISIVAAAGLRIFIQ